MKSKRDYDGINFKGSVKSSPLRQKISVLNVDRVILLIIVPNIYGKLLIVRPRRK